MYFQVLDKSNTMVYVQITKLLLLIFHHQEIKHTLTLCRIRAICVGKGLYYLNGFP